MTDLTNQEITVLNNVSSVLDRNVKLGTKMQELIDKLPSGGTAVNSEKANAILDITGNVHHGELLTISNENSEEVTTEVYEFIGHRSNENPTQPDRIVVDISGYMATAVVVLTIVSKPISGDTMMIGENIYTFVPPGTDTAPGEISVGATVAEARTNIYNNLNGTGQFAVQNPDVYPDGPFDGANMNIKSKVYGTFGNTIASTSSFTDIENLFSSATLINGTDCSNINAATALTSKINEVSALGVEASGNGEVVTITALTGGTHGNNITVSKTITNSNFTGSATALTGGINGTVAKAGKILLGNGYMSVAMNDNTVHDANWVLISMD